MINFSSVFKSFDQAPILEDISFSVKPGERLSIIGPGGCGKTTLLKLLLGLTSCDRGNIDVLGTSVGDASEQQLRELVKSIGMAFQQGGLFDFLTVRENLLFAMENMTQKSPTEMNRTIKELLASVKLSRTEDMFPFELSGGMQRIVETEFLKAAETNKRNLV